MTELLDMNNYSEKNMPFASAVYSLLNNAACRISDEYADCIKKINSFIGTLSDEQKEILEKLDDYKADLTDITNKEWFNMGFKFGVMMMSEMK